MRQYILRFNEIDKTNIAIVGGKGANLGEMFRLTGARVPDGFCVTTKAYLDLISEDDEFQEMLRALERVSADDLGGVAAAGRQIRSRLESLPISDAIVQEINDAFQEIGTEYSYAVRSSATAEDLPGASFAGQQETFLNVKGFEAVLSCVRKCWASLFTDRAIVYRTINGFDHDKVYLSVVVQRMVEPEVSGIMFTADPVTGNRKVVSIDASFGLGEALVSGLVSADLYKVKENTVIEMKVARKKVAIYSAGQGTVQQDIPEDKQTEASLSEEQAIELAQIGKRLEQHFGCPQDIEWGIAGGTIYVLQSRPITTLYPLPPLIDRRKRLFLSIGHPQMMTDAMKPLGISVLRTLAPVGKKHPYEESSLLVEAGNRPYLDVTFMLDYAVGQKHLPVLLSNVDEAMSRALRQYISMMKANGDTKLGKKLDFSFIRRAIPIIKDVFLNIVFRHDPRAVERMNIFINERVEENRKKLRNTSGPERIRCAQEIISSLLPTVFLNIAQYLGAGIATFKLIDTLSRRWLGDAKELGSISKSPVGNVTSEMGLVLGDLSDLAAGSPAIAEYMTTALDETFFAGLEAVRDSSLFQQRFSSFLYQYGMRGTGEIDITRPRWNETPTQLVPAILSHIHGREPGQHRREFEEGVAEANAAAQRLVLRLRQTRWGYFKAKIMARLIKAHRSYIGLREHPKYFIVRNLDLIKQAILEEADGLVKSGALEKHSDIFWLALPEVFEALKTRRVDPELLQTRKAAFERNLKLVPPRAMTSEGEIIKAAVNRENAPQNAIVGSGVSAGVIEGRARVIRKLEEAKMEKGDILVTFFTDPSWTPLFPLASGIVTEVGGLMTHGAVVAREYGIPAVVGVDDAVKIIHDGQYIRINGDQGYIEIIDKH